MNYRMNLARVLILFTLTCFPVVPQAQQQDAELAIEAAQTAVLDHPDVESNRLQLASLYLKAGQNPGAIRTLQAWLNLHPDATGALRLVAVAYLRSEAYSSAKAAAEKALRFGPRDSASLEVLAMAQLGLQSAGDAERLFQEALKLNPNSPEGNLQLGLLYSKQRANLPEAIRLLEKAHALQPKLAGTCAALGSAYLEAGNARQAAASLELAVQLDPVGAAPYYLLASAYKRLHDEQKATSALAAFQIRKKAEAEGRAQEMRSRADYEAGVNLLSNTDQLDQAYLLLQKAAGERPVFDAAYYRMAQVSYLKGDLTHALGSIQKALTLNPLEPEYYYVLARCLQEADPHGAFAAIEKAIALRPGVSDFEDLLRELKNRR